LALLGNLAFTVAVEIHIPAKFVMVHAYAEVVGVHSGGGAEFQPTHRGAVEDLRTRNVPGEPEDILPPDQRGSVGHPCVGIVADEGISGRTIGAEEWHEFPLVFIHIEFHAQPHLLHVAHALDGFGLLLGLGQSR